MRLGSYPWRCSTHTHTHKHTVSHCSACTLLIGTTLSKKQLLIETSMAIGRLAEGDGWRGSLEGQWRVTQWTACCMGDVEDSSVWFLVSLRTNMPNNMQSIACTDLHTQQTRQCQNLDSGSFLGYVLSCGVLGSSVSIESSSVQCTLLLSSLTPTACGGWFMSKMNYL